MDGDDMTHNSGSVPDRAPHEPFEMAVRGYSRSQVDEFRARTNQRISELEERLSRAQGEVERLQAELAAGLRGPASRPAHVELTERMGHILQLAEDEAREQKTRTADEISRLRSQAQQDADTLRAQGRAQVEEILAAAREQADRAVSSARAQAETTTKTVRAETERMAAEAKRQAELTIAQATTRAQRIIEEATARADAVNGHAEARIAELAGRHAELRQWLSEIRDVSTSLVARDTARGSVHDEVASLVAAALATPVVQAITTGNGTKVDVTAAPDRQAESRRSAASGSPAESQGPEGHESALAPPDLGGKPG